MVMVALAALIVPLSLGTGAFASTPAAVQTWTVQVGSESRDQAIQSMAYLPSEVFVNAGDTVNWSANSAEIHTVTLLAAGQTLESTQPFNPSDPLQLLPQGGSVYDGTSYFNSGVMSNDPDSGFPPVTHYNLSFPTPGDYTYYCLVHGMAMKGVVHVRAAGTPYPFTQAQYDSQSQQTERALLVKGYLLAAMTITHASRRVVIAGADNGTVMVMRFISPITVVRVGETVRFVNSGMGAPHTVTFGQEGDPFVPIGTPTNYTGGQLNSGIMPPQSSFSVTFNRSGTFKYICALHDYMGMVGKVIVVG
jgi:plastocyanin